MAALVVCRCQPKGAAEFIQADGLLPESNSMSWDFLVGFAAASFLDWERLRLWRGIGIFVLLGHFWVLSCPQRLIPLLPTKAQESAARIYMGSRTLAPAAV